MPLAPLPFLLDILQSSCYYGMRAFIRGSISKLEVKTYAKR